MVFEAARITQGKEGNQRFRSGEESEINKTGILPSGIPWNSKNCCLVYLTKPFIHSKSEYPEGILSKVTVTSVNIERRK